VSEKAPASRSYVHQGNVTEERALEKVTLKNLNTGGKQGMKTEIGSVERCLVADAAACRERLLDWCNSPHVYFYGNWRAKVPIILQDKGFNEVVTIRRSTSETRQKPRSQLTGSHTYSISERRVSRLSLSDPSSSVSPACTKHPRQSPLWCTRTTLQQCGHSSSSCGVAERESVMLVKSIFRCLSWLLVAQCAAFV